MTKSWGEDRIVNPFSWSFFKNEIMKHEIVIYCEVNDA